MPAELTLIIFITYALAGIMAGLIGGLFGLGGGIVVVPILYYCFIQQGFPEAKIMQLAITTSLATVIVTAAIASYTHHRKGAILWDIAKHLTPAIMIGCISGALLADTVSSRSLQLLFGIFELLVALQIAFLLKPKAQSITLSKTHYIASGISIGLVSTLLGIGGGTMTVPLLLWYGFHLRHAIATSSACSLPIAAIGTIALIATSYGSSDLPQYTIGYLYWPAALIIMTTTLFSAPVGAHLAHYLPVAILKRLFAIVLFIVGVKMLIPL